MGMPIPQRQSYYGLKIPIPLTYKFQAFGLQPSKLFYQFLQFSPRITTSAVCCFVPHDSNFSKPVDVENGKLNLLKRKMEGLGLEIDIVRCTPGQYSHLICPKCEGGWSRESCLSLHVALDRNLAIWRCFRSECGWAGKAFADDREISNSSRKIHKFPFSRAMLEENLTLEPLGDKLIAYFSERMISVRTLKRNAVMQVCGDENVIAFTYKTNGVRAGCKYRSIGKKFWQDRGTEKSLYGLDDIKEAAEIIIVEGEIDKLSMEEVGFSNCVSVPSGAPSKVSTKELPSLEKDTAYQYIWKHKRYFEKASRIILATDGDAPGEALAEELARRLGKDKCWKVSWPRKDTFDCFKDANEVLVNLGPSALKEVILKAQPCQVHIRTES